MTSETVRLLFAVRNGADGCGCNRRRRRRRFVDSARCLSSCASEARIHLSVASAASEKREERRKEGKRFLFICIEKYLHK